MLIKLPDTCRSLPAAWGQQATFTNAFPVSELNVWNRMANQALAGQNRSSSGLEWVP